MGASSIDRARILYRAAIDQLERLPPSGDLYKRWLGVVGRLGNAGVFDPSPADLPIFQRAVIRAREQDDATGLALAGYWRAYCNYALGELPSALVDIDHALVAAHQAGEPKLATQIQALHGKVLAAAGVSPLALSVLDEAIGSMIATQRPGGRPSPSLTYALACRASVLGDIGRLDDAREGFDQALHALPAPGHEVEGSVRCLKGNVLLWHGLWQEAAEEATAAQRIAERVGSLYLLAMARGLNAWAKLEAAGRGERSRLARAIQQLAGRPRQASVHFDQSRPPGGGHGAKAAKRRRQTLRRTSTSAVSCQGSARVPDGLAGHGPAGRSLRE